jgi:hypothetical protein
MRRVRRLLYLLAVVFMLCPCMSMIVHAASAELRFSDPSTTVGAEVDVAIKIYSSADIESLEVTLAYDKDKLRFISGDNATGGDGTIVLSGVLMDGYTLKFQALAEGTGNVTVSQSAGKDSDGAELDMTNGSSAVTIGPGDESLIQEEEGTNGGGTAVANGPQVEVDGVQYVVTNDFSDAVIPEGFSKTEMMLEGETCQVVSQPASNTAAFYLTPVAGGDPDFFLYDGDIGSFLPFETVNISSDRYIVLLRDDGSVDLPKRYQETRLTLNGKEFTAWQDVDMADYYVVYALNADGQKGMYQYDTVDKTYQRYVEHVTKAKTTKKEARGWWGKVLQFVEDFLDIVLIIGIMLMLVLIGFLVLVSVKLRNRNLELDDLYDEYDIDPDRDDPMHKAKKPAPGKGINAAVRRNADEPAVRVPVKTMSLKEEDLFDDYDDEDDDFDGYDSDDYDSDDYDDDDDDYGYEDDDDDYDDYDDEDDGYGGKSNDVIDDLDELLNMQSQKKRGQKKGDTFQVDFIDLD